MGSKDNKEAPRGRMALPSRLAVGGPALNQSMLRLYSCRPSFDTAYSHDLK